MNSKWQTTVLAGALALGMTATWASTARAQDQNGQQGAAQDQGAQGRRGQGRGQGGPGGPGGFARNPTQAVEQLQTQVKELNLSDEQKTKLEAIFKDESEKAKTLTAEVENLQGRERAEKLMPFQRELREKVTGVLNDEQKATLRKNMATRMAKQMTDRYRRATADLGLSDDQKTKVEAVLADAEKKMADALPAEGAGGGAAAPGGQGGGRGGPFGEIGRDTREKVSALLTDEQKPKFEEAMRQRGPGGQGGPGGGRRGRGQGQGGAGN